MLRNTSLKGKLTLISMVTSCVVLLLSCAVIVAFETVSFRRVMVREALTNAKIVADNSAAALSFEDPVSAAQTLRSLAADEHIVMACIYDHAGRPFAHYQPPGATSQEPPPLERNLHRFNDDWREIFQDGYSNDYLELFHDISVGGETIGTVYLRHDMLELRATILRTVYVILGIMVVASLVAFLLTRMLQPLVAGPIMNLAQVVREVTLRKDFSIRAEKHGEDEVGRLIDGFNEMLGEVQQRDFTLQAAQDSLEKRVAGRTEELAESLSLLSATLDSTADGILAVRLSGQVVCYNTQFAVMWGVPASVLEQRSRAEMVTFLSTKVLHPGPYRARIEEQGRMPEAEYFDVIELVDGRCFERYVKPQRVDGRVEGIVLNFRDVSARRRAEAELEKAHRELLETSRQAGMAEVATGVLHNVGNVLNSVNVSAILVAETVRKSKVGNLGRVVALLEQHSTDLGEFVTTDPQGKNLTGFLGQLHQRLAAEQSTLLVEVESLRQNIEHIKEIVSMQQEYAKVSGITEILKVTDLVEDSLRMNAAALTRHRVTVERDFQEVPEVAIEKHKALQILVNLIRNAKYACDDGGAADKRITLRVANGDGCIQISVSDNGVGIPEENMTRIFNHGFTTRKEGHGFGLHSGALAATNMGGALRVQSDGPGLGATFTLELPLTGLSRVDHSEALAASSFMGTR